MPGNKPTRDTILQWAKCFNQGPHEVLEALALCGLHPALGERVHVGLLTGSTAESPMDAEVVVDERLDGLLRSSA